MISKNFSYHTFLIAGMAFLMLTSACKSEEQKDKPTDLNDVLTEMKSDMQRLEASPSDAKAHSHADGTVTVNEVLHTDRYSYLQVTDQNDHSFWVAIPREEIFAGDRITYQDGLMKRNFESKEFNRNFETLYLVSRYEFIERKGGKVETPNTGTDATPKSRPSDIKSGKGNDLGTLYANPTQYAGKSYTVSGKVVKVNFNIMGTNWIHIRDDAFPGLDLTITTSHIVAEGDMVTFTGTIALNKDFGAGYKYDVIMENGKLQN